jgi:outer membrane receptor protein involved in Fe transport
MRVGAAKSREPWSRAGLIALAVAATAGNSPEAKAQSPALDEVPAGAEEGELIIVTGSRIPRPNLTAVSPITVIRSEEVELYGSTLAEELVNALPQAFPDQGSFISNEATGTATVNLRGIGPARTLVLINSRRLLPGAVGNMAPDINIVPTALIDRVDVFTGGASSVYGSDAIAGVVNFILDTDFSGFRIDGQTSVFQHNNRADADVRDALERSGYPYPSGNSVNGGNSDINVVVGTGFADGRGHITAYGGYRKLYAITEDQRDYSSCAFNGRLTSDMLDCGGSTISATGTFNTRAILGLGNFTVGPDRTFVPGVQLFNFAPSNYYQRPGKRWTAGGFASFEFNEAFEPYVEVMYMHDRSVIQIAPGGNFASTRIINCDNPLLSAQQRGLVCQTGNFVGESVNNAGQIVGSPTPFVDPVTGATYFQAFLTTRRRNVEGGPRQGDLKHEDLRLLGGVRGELGRSWSYDAYYLTSRVETSSKSTGNFSAARLVKALDVITNPANGQPACRSALTGEDPDCVPWDIFALNAVSPESVDYLELTSSTSGTIKQRVAVATLTGDLGDHGIQSPWAEEGPGINVGAEYRKDILDFRPDKVTSSGDISGSGAFPPLPVSGSTKVKELFGEVRIPVITRRFIHNLSLEGGYRFSWQSNAENSFTTDSYKLGIDFTPIEPIRFRASYQRAVRAPNVNELFTPIGTYEFAGDPCVGAAPVATQAQCAFTGVTAAQYGNLLANPGAPLEGYNAIFGGNPGLDPETSKTWTIGVVLRPPFLPGFSATIDWFDIDLNGAIFFIDATVIMDTCIQTGDPLFCDRIHRDANGSLWETPQGFVDDTNANIAGYQTSGIDIGVNYSRGLGRLGSVDMEFVGTWLDKLISDAGGLATPFDCVGLYGPFCGTPAPKWRHKARLTWSPSKAVSLSLQWRHFGKVQIGTASDQHEPPLPFLPGSEWIEAQNYFDFSTLFKVGDKFELRMGVRNLFDREPPIVLNNPVPLFGGCFLPNCNGNTFTQIYDPLGRYFFAGVTADF